MKNNLKKKIGIRSSALHFINDPFVVGDEKSYEYFSDALIIIEEGKVLKIGHYDEVIKGLSDEIAITTYKNSLLMPGFIDTHSHYPQTQIIGAYGKQLIDWLNNYTFVAEQQFSNFNYAKSVATVFLDECIKAGTTTVMSYCTVYPESVEAFFEAALEKKMRVIAGKVLMDRNAPDALLDKSVEIGHDQTETLIKKWHNTKRLQYAITPRFAPTSTPFQLESCGDLWKKYPGTYIQTHLSENKNEINWAKELFPNRIDYLDIYDHYQLLGKRAVFGHGIYLSEREWARLSETESSLAHCPTSNQFLGSGLFDFESAKNKNSNVRLGLATDIGAGTSFSQLQSMNEAYKIAQLRGQSLSSFKAFYLATLGAAKALDLEDKIGSLEVGKEADFLILDLASTSLIDFRMKYCKNIEEALFIQMTLGDNRATKAVYINGELAYSQN